MSAPTIADVAEAPRESRFPLGSWDRKPQRTIDFEWTVRERDGETLVVTLHCGHGSKRYYASVSNRAMRPDGSFTWWPMSDKPLMREAAPRYSKGKFEAFAALALEAFRRDAADEFADFLAGEHI